jgi:leucyl-tRNA synthetase
VADHDRARQEDEGIGPQEYTGIKLKLLDLPASLNKKFKNKNLFLVAATLRPETMYGQTNCFVLPEGEYGVFKMRNNDEHYIMSERAAKNMAYQELTAEDKNFTPLAKVKGTELIGKRVKAPLTTYEHVFVLPLPTISMVKGTGIVTSVPSDAPHDY